MANIELMKGELRTAVITPLMEQGFSGKWPHFRKVHPDHIVLLTFQTNKYGGSFTVELSAVFPFSQNKNYSECDSISLDKLNVWDTNRRYRLRGMYDGWFHYRNLYGKRTIFSGTDYLSVSEKEAEGFVPPKGYKLIQQFTPETAEKICECVNLQLKKGFAWVERFVKKELRRNSE